MLLLYIFSISPMLSLIESTCVISREGNNIVADRLLGNWTFSKDLSLFQSQDQASAGTEDMVVSYTNDSSVLDSIPEDNCGFLEQHGLDIYLAGTLQFLHKEYGVMSHTFILTSMFGIPATIYWQGVNAVTNLVQMGLATNHQQDILFLGEKTGEKAFSVLVRAGTNTSLCSDPPRQ